MMPTIPMRVPSPHVLLNQGLLYPIRPIPSVLIIALFRLSRA